MRLKDRLKSGSIFKPFYDSRLILLNIAIDKRKEQYNQEITVKLEAITKTINKTGYDLPLKKASYQVQNKDIFTVGDNIETLFVSKHLQNILGSVYSLQITNRDLVTSRLSTIIKNASPKIIIRADVESFYESISHEKLLNILHSSQSLSVSPRRILTQLIRSYSKLTNNTHGLPRGVGISAYLSEVFMKDIDDKLRYSSDVIYYERYVDDLIIAFAPLSNSSSQSYLENITNTFSDKNLKLNSKTKIIDLHKNANGSFEYLGYKFGVNGPSSSISISKNKFDRYKTRIDIAFNAHINENKHTPRMAYINIVTRLKFLTGNTRLYNNKSNAFIGIYFSNKCITNTKELKGLDGYLSHKLCSISDNKLKKRLSKLSFEKGFDEKIFRKFTIKELSKISKAWKHG